MTLPTVRRFCRFVFFWMQRLARTDSPPKCTSIAQSFCFHCADAVAAFPAWLSFSTSRFSRFGTRQSRSSALVALTAGTRAGRTPRPRRPSACTAPCECRPRSCARPSAARCVARGAGTRRSRRLRVCACLRRPMAGLRTTLLPTNRAAMHIGRLESVLQSRFLFTYNLLFSVALLQSQPTTDANKRTKRAPPGSKRRSSKYGVGVSTRPEIMWLSTLPKKHGDTNLGCSCWYHKV